MRGQKGYSLVELLTVVVIIAFVALLLATGAIKEIDKARGTMLVSHARLVYTAAQAVIVESKAYDTQVSDYDYTAGFTGAVNDASQPVRTKISQRMRELVTPDVVLAAESGEGVAKAVFAVKDGVVLSLYYEAMYSGRYYSVTIADGEAVVARVYKDG